MAKELYLGFNFQFRACGLSTFVPELQTKQLALDITQPQLTK